MGLTNTDDYTCFSVHLGSGPVPSSMPALHRLRLEAVHDAETTQKGKVARTADREMHKAQVPGAASQKPKPPSSPSMKGKNNKQIEPSGNNECTQRDEVLPRTSRSPPKRAEKAKKTKKDERGRSKSAAKKRRRKQSSSTGSRSCAYSPRVKRKNQITRRNLSCST